MISNSPNFAEQIVLDDIDVFLEQFLIRDGTGQIIDIKCSRQEFSELLNGKHIPSARALEKAEGIDKAKERFIDVNIRFNKIVPQAVKTAAQEKYNTRVQQLSPIDQLKQLALNPEQNPAEAAVVAKMYLYGWFGTPIDPDYARSLLETVRYSWRSIRTRRHFLILRIIRFELGRRNFSRHFGPRSQRAMENQDNEGAIDGNNSNHDCSVSVTRQSLNTMPNVAFGHN